jgi:hypothetical protein
MYHQICRRSSWLLCCCMCITTSHAFAAQAVTMHAVHYCGRVIDKSTGKPIEAARIRLVSPVIHAEWRTDAKGRFSFWVTSVKNHGIEIEHEGYQVRTVISNGGTSNNIRLQPIMSAPSKRIALATPDAIRPLTFPSQAVAPAIVTADSPTELIGRGRGWSRWYRVGIGPAPSGYKLQRVEFWLSGDGACGFSAECHEVARTNQQVLWQFRIHGHMEAGAPARTSSAAHLRAVYYPQEEQ